MTHVTKALSWAMPVVAICCFAAVAHADWQPQGSVQGVPTFLDTETGLTWTATLGRVPSADWGRGAKAHVQQLGFRLPTFLELQVMYNAHGGGRVLRIRNGLFDYYETADPNILGNACGNGFQTQLQRQGVGNNLYLGVR
jgi:hypothetical protein